MTVIFYLVGHKKGLCYKKCKPNKAIRWSDFVGFDDVARQDRRLTWGERPEPDMSGGMTRGRLDPDGAATGQHWL